MGESAAYLVPPFSQLSPTSKEENTGNTIQRALTASVSFGRFVSESLDWEKWSAFTSNRYLEEVEKYSKPGSVAEKKAYFEAHFKRRRAAALLEQQNAAVCTVSKTENTEDKVEDYSSNMKEAEIHSSSRVVSAGKSGNHGISAERTLEDTKLLVTQKAMEPLALMELTNHLEHAVGIGETASNKEVNEDDSAIRNSASVENTHEVSFAKMQSEGVAFECPTSVKPPVPVQLKDSDIDIPESKRNSTESNNKRRSYTTSLHMSINFVPCSGAAQKDRSLGLSKSGNTRIIRAPAKKYKNSGLSQTSTTASVTGLVKHSSIAPSAENRRTVRTHGDSISVAKTADENIRSTSSKSSNLFVNRARLPTVPSTFTFKSDERAVKRREFFQMLEQKGKLKEKHQMHAKSQGKGKISDKDVCNSNALKTSKEAEAPLRNITKKIPTARSVFPKIEERAVAFKSQDNNNIIRPRWRCSVKMTEGSRDFVGKNSRPPKKKMNENASPNIQF